MTNYEGIREGAIETVASIVRYYAEREAADKGYIEEIYEAFPIIKEYIEIHDEAKIAEKKENELYSKWRKLKDKLADKLKEII